jgi:hypothetical protein
MLVIAGIDCLARRRDHRDRGRTEQCRGSGPPADRNLFRVRLRATGTLFLFGIVVGAVASLRPSVLLAGARRSGVRGSHARRAAARLQREMAFINRARDTRLEHQQHVDTADEGLIRRRGSPLLGRWSRDRQPINTEQVEGAQSRGA